MSENVLEEHSEAQAWLEYKKTRNPKLRDSFIRQYAPLVRYVAGKVAMGLPQNVDYDDLVGFGVFGLIDAIDKFDPEKHVKFKTYAVTRIRGAIFDELRAIDWVPRSVRQKSREVEEAIVNLESRLGRQVSDQEIAGELGMSEEDFNDTMLKISGTSMLSLNDVWYTGDENDKVSIVESIESPQTLNPDNIVEREVVRKVIIEALQELPEKEKKVLILYYYEDLTLKEIGKVLEVTESRISQLHTKAILRLRARLMNARKGIF
ncbi:MAG: RNA polymerase sigma factor WhiG [Spirochaetales bacterium]|nr:RNA polymerase sigma factor WhiG [Spirochaetales bacterium]